MKTICFRGNLSSPGVKTVLKIKRYAQRLTKDIWEMEAPGDGLLVIKHQIFTSDVDIESWLKFLIIFLIFLIIGLFDLSVLPFGKYRSDPT